MREIGGFFELDQFGNNEYYKDIITLNSGRNALLYLLKTRSIKKIYIPYYLCNSVSDMCNKNGYKFEYYKIDANFIPIFDKTLAQDEYLYVVNYYGQLTNENIFSLKDKFIQIILDNTQAFFQKPIDGMDTIYSCRKFFGVPDGSYLSTNKKLNKELEVDISKERMAHILGRYEGIASNYYSDFQNNDECFNDEPLKYMSKLTHNILGAIDYDRVCQIRNKNYAYLEKELGENNKLKLITPDGAFAYPFYVKNGIEIRKIMSQNKIYIPTLWPNVLNNVSKDNIEYEYVVNILPLPCDQRYGLEDMKYIVDCIHKELKRS